MENNLKKEDLVESGDTCGGVAKPSGDGDWICDNGKWVKVDVPAEDPE